MIRSAAPFAFVAVCALSSPAHAQRAEENAVEEAEDAFGTSVGDEKIGLYNSGEVRGFSPSTAGNIRIEGLAITQHGGLHSRYVAGSAIRVGLTAQGYPFLAPTGIADFTLRGVGTDTVLSAVGQIGPYGTLGLSADAKLPLFGKAGGLAAGASYKYEENFPGVDGHIVQGGAVLDLRPASDMDLKAFYGRLDVIDDRDVGSIFVGGPYLPPEIERRDFGLEWTESRVSAQVAGGLGTLRISDDWQLRAGLFYAEGIIDRNATELYRGVQPDGSAQRTVVTSQDTTARSFSGEMRSSYSITEGNRRHTLHAALRGRDTRRQFGGADVRNLGDAVIGVDRELPEPDYVFGPRTRDTVRQLTAGVGYELRWLDVGELSLGVQKTDYRKQTVFPDPARPAIRTKASPWLFNGAVALRVSEALVAYAGYTRGLEDSAAAPADAVNRNEPPPALLTSQRDAGIRYALTPDITLVAGVFDVRKPYFNLDPGRVYRELGTVRHRGVEISLAGRPIEGLNVVAGAVLLDADVTGEAVELGIIGPKPVGISPLVVRANLDYRLPFFDPVSVDLGIAHSAGQVASALTYGELGGNQLRTGAQTTFDLGARYRLKAGAVPITLRAQITNLFDVYAWEVSSNSAFAFNPERRFQLSVAADF
ncbi:Ferrichrome receptor FcuA precursor [Tsuneonella dongtanensis]|uniref:Ferrichrome receptor FcuA n=1 Tax=Tsuneonella dongtanensis TaxID=692370 RepID=A0A1B2AGP6_9SPHN|nr:TonB-dependent receptor [Tsuneonella dongtanensis]ANY21291.1 Ferrichrome receptor FcuA precursor [Tsuneonella dongtanensis]